MLNGRERAGLIAPARAGGAAGRGSSCAPARTALITWKTAPGGEGTEGGAGGLGGRGPARLIPECGAGGERLAWQVHLINLSPCLGDLLRRRPRRSLRPARRRPLGHLGLGVQGPLGRPLPPGPAAATPPRADNDGGRSAWAEGPGGRPGRPLGAPRPRPPDACLFLPHLPWLSRSCSRCLEQRPVSCLSHPPRNPPLSPPTRQPLSSCSLCWRKGLPRMRGDLVCPASPDGQFLEVSLV